MRRQRNRGEGVAVRIRPALHLPDLAEVGVAQAADEMRNLRHHVGVGRKMLDDAESVDVDRGQPGAEGRLVARTDGDACHPHQRRVPGPARLPWAAARQAGAGGRFGAMPPQPAGMVVAHQPLRVPGNREPAVWQHLGRSGRQIARQVHQHDHLLPGHRMNGAEIRAELSQPHAGQRAGAAIIPADLHVAIHDARAVERAHNGIGIVVRHRKRLRHGTLRPVLMTLSLP